MKKKVISFIVALALAVTAALGAFPSLYEDSGETAPSTEGLIGVVEINEKNFPDENFRNYVKELEASVAEGEADGILGADELSKITSVSVSSKYVKSLKGIEFFTFLEVLDCSHNPLTELDLSGNPNIKRLDCSHTMLTSLNLTDIIGAKLEALELNDSIYTVFNCKDGSFDFDLSSLPGDFDFSRVSDLKVSKQSNKPEVMEETEAESEKAEEPEAKTEAEPAEQTQEAEAETKQETEEPFEPLLKDITNGDTVTYTYDIGCGLSAEFMIVFKYGHNLTAAGDRSSACTSADELWQCLNCGKYFADEDGKTEAAVSGSHSFDEGVTETEATCTSSGIVVKTCTVCGYESHEEIEMLPHTTNDEYETDYGHHWKICSVCGELVGEKESHTFEEDSNICLVCGEVFEHRHMPEFAEEKAPTCMTEGMKEHYFCAECGKYFEDSECTVEILPDDLILEITDHQYEYKFNDTEHWEQCKFCGDKKASEIHELETSETEPSCWQAGSLTNSCHICGYIESEEVIPATGEHNFGSDNGSKYGMDDELHWLNCTTEGCTQKIDQSEHNYTKLEIVKEPTCAEEGILNHICEVCGHSRSEPIEAVGKHTYGDLYSQTDELNHVKLCTVCGEPSEAEAHEFDEGIVIKEATCENGIIRYTCVCGYHKDERVPAEGKHDFTNGFVDLGEQHYAVCNVCGEASGPSDHDYGIEIVKPSCIESGKMIYTCKDCGHSYEEITSGPTGLHVFSSDFTLDGSKHIHKCETDGCKAVDEHEAAECDKTAAQPSKAPSKLPSKVPANSTNQDSSVSFDQSISGGTLIEVPAVSIVWPAAAGVVLNPYKMKIKIDTVSEGKPITVSEDINGSGETVLSNELIFINNSDVDVNVSVTGSVKAVTSVDKNGSPLVDSEGNPATQPSNQITFASAPIKQPAWSADGTKLIAGDTRNSILLYLEVASKLDPTGKKGIYTGAYDSKNTNQMLLGTRPVTKTLFGIAAKNGNNAGVTNVKICGDISTAPAVGWNEVAKTNSIEINLIFDASLVPPLPEKPALLQDEDSAYDET